MPGILPIRAGRAPLFAFGPLALAVVLAGCGGPSRTLPTTGQPGPTATATATFANATPTALATPTAEPTPSPSPTVGPCSATDVAIAITADSGIYWQGAAGSKDAKFTLTNAGSVDCTISVKAQPLLLNGDGAVLIAGATADTSDEVTVPAGSSVSTEVQTGNLCHAPTIVAPVRVAFILPGIGTIVATTASPTDDGGVPPCSGDPKVKSGVISMTPWTA